MLPMGNCGITTPHLFPQVDEDEDEDETEVVEDEELEDEVVVVVQFTASSMTAALPGPIP